jgi:N-acyl homoserine lactone hydrolase
MTTSPSSPQRLYLMRVATMFRGEFTAPIPCYLVQTGDGKNILIDSGLPINFQSPPDMAAQFKIELGKSVIEQLASIGVQPADIDILISTHYDVDHAGNNAAFPNAQLVAQRLQHEVASGGHPRFELVRSQWEHPDSRYQLLDGDTELLPGLELIETSGHVPGHQSVLVHLPHTGPVLLAIDAVAVQDFFRPDRPGGPMDADGPGAIASTRKLIDLAEKKHASLIVFGHDHPQWSTLKLLPDYYD